MSQTLTISDHLYDRLETEAQHRGLENIERLLENLLPDSTEDAAERRAREAIDRVLDLHNRLAAKHGFMLDSGELIQEDRAR